MSRKPHLVTLASIALLALSLVVPAAVAGATAAPLTGEFLLGEGEGLDVTATCSETGTSTISYSVEGTAFGPYPGTFTEVGTVTIGQTPTGSFILGFPIKQVTTLEAFFTIDSPAGQVTGSKRLITQSNLVHGLCEDFLDYEQFPGAPIISGSFQRVCACAFGLSYEALIETPTGMFQDEGESGLLIEELQLTAGSGVQEADVFNEGFSSSGIVEVSRVGKATGGGQIDSGIAFGFSAQSNGGLKGGCTVIDQAADIKIKCRDVTSYFQTATKAIFQGNAEVNGEATTYRIVVEDNAESGSGGDRFSITTGSGYSASGSLKAGNVQVHK
jgi:hypothetical protein